MFDNKITSFDVMKYTDAKKAEWLKTTRNYLISKAFEMRHYLHCAESSRAASSPTTTYEPYPHRGCAVTTINCDCYSSVGDT